MDPIQLPAGLEFTALQTAADRAKESARPDALFTDPLAVQMITHVQDRHGHDFAALNTETDLNWLLSGYVAIRTHFLDEKLLAAAHGGIRQVVMLAAGMDGRSYRLQWPSGTRIFEVDKPELLDFKAQVLQKAALQATAAVTPVPADLNGDWLAVLKVAGFLPEQLTLWLAEGILGYLSSEEADRIVEGVSASSAPGSHLLTVYVHGDPMALAHRTGRDKDETVARLEKLLRAGPSKEPGEWLGSYGWTADVTTIAAWAERLRRSLPPAMDPALDGATGYLVDAYRS